MFIGEIVTGKRNITRTVFRAKPASNLAEEHACDYFVGGKDAAPAEKTAVVIF